MTLICSVAPGGAGVLSRSQRTLRLAPPICQAHDLPGRIGCAEVRNDRARKLVKVSGTDGFDLPVKTMQPLRSYIQAQGVACAVINAVLNPAIAWLGNRQMAFVPLSGDNSIIVDTAVTSIVLSLLVSLFVTPAAHREFRAGRLTGSATVSWERGVLAHLPSNAWSFGLLMGVVAAAIITPLMFVTFRMLGSAGVSFAGFIVLKAVYTAALGFAVTRWTILRQMLYWLANSPRTG